MVINLLKGFRKSERNTIFINLCSELRINMKLDFLISPGQLTVFIVSQILISLILFIAILALIVFTIRKPLRKYKPKDLAVFDKVQHIITTPTTRFMQVITFFGKHQFLIPANLLLIFYFLWIPRQTWFSIRVATIALSSLALMLILKQLFRRKRPLAPLLKAARGLSFPSGHAIMAVTFFGLLIYCILHSLWPPPIRIIVTILLVVVILLIGFSRIYLKVHYTSDVLAGFIIGLIWLLISLFVIRKAEEFSKSADIGEFSVSLQWKGVFQDL